MEKISFFSVLISNLKCAFCENKSCQARYYPHRANYYFYNGKKVIVHCEKDNDKCYNDMLKPWF